MRNKVAKKLRKEVALKLYVGDDVSRQDVLDDIKSCYAEKQFKSVARAKKKNHYRHSVSVNRKIGARQLRLEKNGKVKRYKLPKKLEKMFSKKAA